MTDEKVNPTPEPTPEAAPVEKTNLGEAALQAVAQMKEQVEAMKVENDRADKRFALEQLGGRTEAGKPAPEVKEETPAEYKDRVMRGEFNVKATPQDT